MNQFSKGLPYKKSNYKDDMKLLKYDNFKVKSNSLPKIQSFSELKNGLIKKKEVIDLYIFISEVSFFCW